MPMASAPSRESSSPDSPTRTPAAISHGPPAAAGTTRGRGDEQPERGRGDRRQPGQRAGERVGRRQPAAHQRALGAGAAVPPRPRGQVLVPAQHPRLPPPVRSRDRPTAGTVGGCSPASPPPAGGSSSSLVAARGRRGAAALAAVLVSRPRPPAAEPVPRTGPGRCCSCPATAARPASLRPLADRLDARGRDATVVAAARRRHRRPRGRPPTRSASAVDAALARTGADERRRRRLLRRRRGRPAVGGRRRRRRRPPGGDARLAAPRHVAGRPGRRRSRREQCPVGCRQLATGSDLLRRLNAGDETPEGPTWVSIWTDAGPDRHPAGLRPPRRRAEPAGAVGVRRGAGRRTASCRATRSSRRWCSPSSPPGSRSRSARGRLRPASAG